MKDQEPIFEVGDYARLKGTTTQHQVTEVSISRLGTESIRLEVWNSPEVHASRFINMKHYKSHICTGDTVTESGEKFTVISRRDDGYIVIRDRDTWQHEVHLDLVTKVFDAKDIVTVNIPLLWAPKFKAGDKVRCTKDSFFFTKGKVYEIEKIYESGFIRCLVDDRSRLGRLDSQFAELVEEESKFKAGDKVLCTKSMNSFTKGKVYEIEKIYDSGNLCCRADGGDLRGLDSQFAELVTEEEPKTVYLEVEPGTKVIINHGAVNVTV